MMFKKLVSNLPFSPSLINQISFYSKRLRKEQATRKLSLVFVALMLMVQSVTFIAPAQSTLAASANDIIYNGNGKTKEGIIRAYQNNRDQLGRTDIQKIFNHYGINATNLAASRVVTIKSSPENNIWSTGRAPRGHGGEMPDKIPGGPTIYARTLHGWVPNRNWAALEVNTAKGIRWILLECGNVAASFNAPTPTNPDMTVTKTASKKVVKKGEVFTYTIKATNIGNAIAKNVVVYDDAPDAIEILGHTPTQSTRQGARRYVISKPTNFAPKQTITYTLQARAIKWGPVNVQNIACTDFFDINIFNNCGEAPNEIPQGCPLPGKENIAKDDPLCKTNPGIDIKKTSDTKDLKVGDTFTYTLQVTNKGDVALPKVTVKDIAPSELEFIDAQEPGKNEPTVLPNKREYVSVPFSLNTKESKTISLTAKVLRANPSAVKNTACATSDGSGTAIGACDDDTIIIKEVCETNPALAKDDPGCFPACPIEGKEHLTQNDAGCRPCDESAHDQEGRDISCLIFSKSARNVTQNITDANGTQAKAGDNIEYTLTIKNTSKETRSNFVIEENLEDVLEYADIIDAGGATFQETPIRMLSWDPVDLKPGEETSRTILIKVKSPIPATPTSTSDPYSYDLKMTNVYGNTVEITLPPHPVKTIERTITRLPNTGLGTNALISTILLSGATYFYYRSRLLVKEVGIVRHQFNHSMGA